MADRWIDVSANQDPRLMRWPAWGFPRGQYRLVIGRNFDTAWVDHRAGMRAAGMLTGPYGVPWEGNNQADDCWRWVDAIPPDDENDDWVDAERERLTEVELDVYCTTYDYRSPRQRLAIYTGYPWWMSHVVTKGRAARYARYKLIIAGYPFDTPPTDKNGKPQSPPMDPDSVALRSTPPHNRRPAIPPPWTVEDGWQHTGQGSAAGYGKFLDMGIYRVNPGPPPPLPPPVPDAAVAAVRAAAGRILGRMG